MNEVWVIEESVISPLGNSVEENFAKASGPISGVHFQNDLGIFAGRIEEVSNDTTTRFETICIRCIQALLADNDLDPTKTVFVLSTTKGNIALLESSADHPRLRLHDCAKFIGEKCGLKNVLVVSNACVSGVMAIAVAKRYLQSGAFEHAVVLGADELTSFVVSGFKSLGALSDDICRPFDHQRKGINLGEAAAAILLSTKPEKFSLRYPIRVLGFGLSNDANHISGPSRTGEELALAINTALVSSKLDRSSIDFISAHGTATLYNDEMESKAFSLVGLEETPVHSLKGIYGHTLGAAGVLEAVIGIQSLKNNVIVPSFGFERSGVSKAINVLREPIKKNVRTFLKTASGFGGCNAALVIEKQ